MGAAHYGGRPPHDRLVQEVLVGPPRISTDQGIRVALMRPIM
jgi:hypothetical protein